LAYGGLLAGSAAVLARALATPRQRGTSTL